MYNQPYFIPGYINSFSPYMMRGPMIGGMGRSIAGIGSAINGARGGANIANAGRGLGILGKLGNSMKSIKAINWGGLINNTSKTLNVVNQAIPLVRQVGPMMNNMKSMLRVASIFKDETDVKPVRNNTKVSNKPNTKPVNINNSIDIKKEVKQKEEYISNDNSPTFFINN